MNIRRTATIGSALIVGAIAALASYSHMRGLALRYGQTEVIADLLPISVDGMMVVATIALGDGRRYRWSAWLAFWVGVAASVVANVLAAEPSVIARCISAWPAIAFLLVVEVITRGGRIRALEQPVTVAATSATSPVDVAAAVPDTTEDSKADTAPDGGADTRLAPKRTPARLARRTESRTAGRPSNKTKVQAFADKNPDASPAEIAARLKVSPKTVRRHLPDRTPTPAPDSPADKTPDTEPDTPPINGTPVPELVTTAGGQR